MGINLPGGRNGSGRGGGPRPPNIDEVIEKIQKLISKLMPGGKSGSSKPIIFGLILLVVVWAFSGLYRVLPDEQGVVLRFGKFVSDNSTRFELSPSLSSRNCSYSKSYKSYTEIDIGFRAASDSGRTSEVGDVPEESLMLTGDENIVNIDFSVFWVIKDAGKFLFKIQSPVVTVKATAETAMREVIARSKLQPILTKGRSLIEIETQEIMQSLLDEYESGIQITQVQTQKADPPDEVIDAFRDVQAARADMERSKNEAEGYQNDVIPRARGDAAKILQEAEAYKKKVIAMAEGEASRFLAIYKEYAQAKRVTQERMYLETMEKVLADIDKVIIDRKAGGVVPYLPLPAVNDEIERNRYTMKLGKFILPLIFVIGLVVYLSLFTVKEINQAIVLQFGDPKKVNHYSGSSSLKFLLFRMLCF